MINKIETKISELFFPIDFFFKDTFFFKFIEQLISIVENFCK